MRAKVQLLEALKVEIYYLPEPWCGTSSLLVLRDGIHECLKGE